MADVWLAEHLGLGREVAIKIIKPEVSLKPNSVRRFLSEARILASKSHPNLVEVFDIGTLADGRPYMVMPRLFGRTLEDLLEQVGSLPLPEVVRLLEGVADALDMLHGRGLVHRDIKPDNLFASVSDDGEERVLIIDFGLARVLQGVSYTSAGVIVGTPYYLPPEFASSKGTPAGDIYSFGVVAYELFSGRLPFHRASLMELMRAKVHEDAPRISTMCSERVHPIVDELFRRVLSRDPNERPAGCGDFIRALATVGMTPAAGMARPLMADSGDFARKRKVPTLEDQESRHDTYDDQVPLESGTRPSVPPGRAKPDSATG